jgi:hypothetical protein
MTLVVSVGWLQGHHLIVRVEGLKPQQAAVG